MKVSFNSRVQDRAADGGNNDKEDGRQIGHLLGDRQCSKHFEGPTHPAPQPSEDGARTYRGAGGVPKATKL